MNKIIFLIFAAIIFVGCTGPQKVPQSVGFCYDYNNNGMAARACFKKLDTCKVVARKRSEDKPWLNIKPCVRKFTLK